MTNIQETPGQHNVGQFPDVALGRWGVVERAVDAFRQSYSRMALPEHSVVSSVIPAADRFQQAATSEVATDVAQHSEAADPDAPLDIAAIRQTIRNLHDAA